MWGFVAADMAGCLQEGIPLVEALWRLATPPSPICAFLQHHYYKHHRFNDAQKPEVDIVKVYTLHRVLATMLEWYHRADRRKLDCPSILCRQCGYDHPQLLHRGAHLRSVR